MKPLAWLAVGTLLYAMSLAVLAPARLLDAMLDDASAGHLRLASTAGTVWSGRGVVDLRDEAGGSRWAAPLAWRLRASSLLAGRLDYRVISGGPATSVTGMSFSHARVEVSGVDIRIPASTLAAGIPGAAPWGVAGEIRLVADRVGFGPDFAQGSLALHWQSAGSALSPVSPLGDYVFDVQARDHAWQARLRTVTGPLQLNGHGTWAPGHRPAFVAIAEVPPAIRGELDPFLRLVAVDRGVGRFEWRLQ